MSLTLTSTTTLNNGVEMPLLGLGTFESASGSETQDAVRWALEAGYRHIDTAAVYGNEQDVGLGLKNSGIPREQVFITTKLWIRDYGTDSAVRAFEASLRRLGSDYVDLFLLHWPVPREKRQDAWKGLLKIYETGRARAIGVSNYLIHHLEELLVDSPVVPAVNQFELSPYNTRQGLVDFCRKNRIQVESWGPLVRGQKFNDPALIQIAVRYDKTPAQVLIRWAIDNHIVVIPKSTKRERIIENAQVFDFQLSDEDLRRLAAMNEDLYTIRPGFMNGEW